MMEQLSTTYQYDINLLKRTINRRWKRAIYIRLLVTLILLSLLIFVWNMNYWLAGFFSGLSYMVVIQTIAQYKQGKRYIINSYSMLTTTASFTEQGYKTDSQAIFKWSDMSTISRYADSWQITLTYGAFLILPLQDVPVTMQAAILEKAQHAGCKIK